MGIDTSFARRPSSAVFAVLVLLLFDVGIVEAQDAAPGRIGGVVVNGETAEPVVSAQVYLAGTELGTLTDLKGRYHIDRVPPGTHDLVVRVIGFATKTVTGVRVEPGGSTSLDVTLDPQAVELEGITVSVEAERGSAASLLTKQRTNVAVSDAIGAQDIGRSPDSDAAESAKRITGVTVAEGKYVYVRGLGERYSQTSLNGSPLPSPEPERAVVPLDLFPAGFLESLTTQKTYTPDQPGDFSGGSVEIATREFPNQFTYKLSFGSSFNTESQFLERFLSGPGGSLDFLGIDDGGRDLPEAIGRELGGIDGERLPADPEVRERLGESFLGTDLVTFTPTTGTTPANGSGSFSLGDRVDLAGKDVGYLLAFTYSNSFQLRQNEVERKWRTSAFDPSLPEDRRAPNVDYTFTRGSQTVNWGGIGNFTFLLAPKHQLTLKTLYNRNAENESRRFFGANREDLGGELVDHRIRFVARSLAWGQVGGEHLLPGGVKLDWKGSAARATRDEPGLRETIFKRAFNAPEGEPFVLDDTGESARFLFSELVEDDLNGRLDLTIPFLETRGGTSAFKVGGAARRRTRDFAARRFRFEFLSGSRITSLDSALSVSTIVGRVDEPDEFALTEIVEPGDVYDVDDETYAGYGMVDLAPARWLRLVGGVRVESYDLELVARGRDSASTLDQTDLLPAVNATVRLGERVNLRGAWSRTLDRPEFRELAPFQFTEAASLRQIFGNPDLEIARIENFDLRWEWYFSPGEVLTLAGFFKGFDRPIEQVFVATAGTAYSYQNAEGADLLGAELGVRKRLGFVAPGLENLTFQGNVAVIDSEVRVRTGGVFDPTNLRRALEGQSPWTANANLSYASPDGKTEAGVFFNMYGERIVAAGGSGLPDIEERPRAQLDVTFQRDLLQRLQLKFKATNLLDAAYVWHQEANGISLIQRKYEAGRTFSLSFSFGS